MRKLNFVGYPHLSWSTNKEKYLTLVLSAFRKHTVELNLIFFLPFQFRGRALIKLAAMRCRRTTSLPEYTTARPLLKQPFFASSSYLLQNVPINLYVFSSGFRAFDVCTQSRLPLLILLSRDCTVAESTYAAEHSATTVQTSCCRKMVMFLFFGIIFNLIMLCAFVDIEMYFCDF